MPKCVVVIFCAGDAQAGDVQTKALNVDIMVRVKEAWDGIMALLGSIVVLWGSLMLVNDCVIFICHCHVTDSLRRLGLMSSTGCRRRCHWNRKQEVRSIRLTSSSSLQKVEPMWLEATSPGSAPTGLRSLCR